MRLCLWKDMLRMDERANIYGLTFEELEELVTEWGQPAYRAEQIWTWLYRHLVPTFDEMTTLPKTLRTRLTQAVRLGSMAPLAKAASTDGFTRKWLLGLADEERIEAVLMRYDERETACISVQVGCAYACSFCATGRMGLVRDLTAGEIVEQVVFVERMLRHLGQVPAADSGHALSNIVFMGMGEPLSNYHNTLKAAYILNHPEGLNVGARRMTLSTVGLVPAIRRLAEEPLQVNLAISLHAPTDALRRELVPINDQFPIAALMEAAQYYTDRTGRRLTFEYVMIDGVNDGPIQAVQLADLLDGTLAHVNLIPLNPVPNSAWVGSNRETVEAFAEIMRSRGIPTTVRVRRGIDIAAGCGQLFAEGDGHGRSIVPLEGDYRQPMTEQYVIGGSR